MDKVPASNTFRIIVTKAVLLVITAALLGFSNPSSGNKTQSKAHFFFLEQLQGQWQGSAIETPVGPIKYDIAFVTQADGRVCGVADTGASAHHWCFYLQDSKLKLWFLSTFGGNQAPLHLEYGGEQQGQLQFNHQKQEYLQVKVRLTANNMILSIRLRGKPHVRIELMRTLA